MRDAKFNFQEIHALYRPKILRYLTRLVGAAQAEDLTQEVFVKLHHGLETFQGKSALSTWLYRIATNTAIDKLRTQTFRSERRARSLEELNETVDAGRVMTAEAHLPEQLALQNERRECFADYVEKLPLKYRTVVVLSELEQLTDKEIAAILGLSVNTVKIRLHRGKAILLQELKSECKPEDWL